MLFIHVCIETLRRLTFAPVFRNIRYCNSSKSTQIDNKKKTIFSVLSQQ